MLMTVPGRDRDCKIEKFAALRSQCRSRCLCVGVAKVGTARALEDSLGTVPIFAWRLRPFVVPLSRFGSRFVCLKFWYAGRA